VHAFRKSSEHHENQETTKGAKVHEGSSKRGFFPSCAFVSLVVDALSFFT